METTKLWLRARLNRVGHVNSLFVVISMKYYAYGYRLAN